MDRAGFPMALGGDARRIDCDQPAAGCLRRRRALIAAARVLGAPRPHPTNDVGDLAVVWLEQIALTDQRVLDLARELEPLSARPRAQVAERADGVLARPFRGMHRLHQKVIGVRPALVGANRSADVHASLCIANHQDIKRKSL